eukprot:TRINITY_DN12292_c0_g1_i1.p1 TRINITY_DN12292_c0_g1~~TRINITY_DN12292_c0_g1_i1.p1  ORF type:complete len:154 (+),score=27.70 TRINITY_DN12292_c0_g1_i1:20-481(+)
MSTPQGKNQIFVVPVDTFGSAKAAFKYALDKSTSADTIILFHGQHRIRMRAGDGGMFYAEEDKREVENARQLFDKYTSECTQSGRNCTWVQSDVLGVEELSSKICRLSKLQNATEIVMGTRAMGALGNFVLGSTSLGVLHCADVPVTIVKNDH